MKTRFINILNTEKKRRGAFAFLVLLLCTALAGGLIACTAAIEHNSEEYNTYTVEGITVSVPKEYADLVVVDTEGNDEWMHEVIALYYKPAYDEHADFGWMFSIMRCDYAQMLTLIGGASDGVSFKATDGDNYYFYYEPTDVQWSSPEEYEEYTNICDSINVSYGELEEFSNSEWQPQPEYGNQDDYSRALDAALQSVNTEEIAVEDMGDNEKTARAWMVAWFDMYKALPKDNMAYITEGVVDRLNVVQVSKEGLPKAFIFSVTFSVRPTYPIASNSFWAAGNTSTSPGRDETWGQMGREVELRQGDDGRYHFVSMGTGGAGNPDIYDMVDVEGTTDEISGLFSYSVSDIEKIEFQDGNTGRLVSYTAETEMNDIIEHLNAFRYDQIEPANDGWTYAVRIWFKDGSDMQRIELRPSSACVGGNCYISSEHEYFPQEWLEQYRTTATLFGLQFDIESAEIKAVVRKGTDNEDEWVRGDMLAEPAKKALSQIFEMSWQTTDEGNFIEKSLNIPDYSIEIYTSAGGIELNLYGKTSEDGFAATRINDEWQRYSVPVVEYDRLMELFGFSSTEQ